MTAQQGRFPMNRHNFDSAKVAVDRAIERASERLEFWDLTRSRGLAPEMLPEVAYAAAMGARIAECVIRVAVFVYYAREKLASEWIDHGGEGG